MRRREFISIVGGASLLPLAARAQQGSNPVVGYLHVGTADHNTYLRDAFRRGLNEAGYTDGKNVTIEYRMAEGRFDRLPSLAADLVHRQVSVIAAASTPAAVAAKGTGTTIPIVFETAGDPIKLGLVKSLNHPGDNVTGVTQLSSELISKRLGLLHELIPGAKSVGLLLDRHDPRTESQVADMEEAARGLGMQIHVFRPVTKLKSIKASPAFPKLERAVCWSAPGNSCAGGPNRSSNRPSRQVCRQSISTANFPKPAA